jgi:vacuolar protein sorting-associated protein 11
LLKHCPHQQWKEAVSGIIPESRAAVQALTAHKISAFAALDDLSQIAVGFANGSVTVIRGDLIHDLGTKQRIIYESDEPITGVELAADAKGTTLFVATTARILKLLISKKGHSQPPKTVEDSGCGVGCMSIDKRTGEIVVARDDAIYYYTMEGRGPPSAYEAPKSLVAVYQEYVAVVCPPANTPTREPDSMRRRFGGTADALLNASTFVLLEPQLRVIGHTESLISPVKSLFPIWGDLFLLTQDGKIYRYHEKPLQQRLEMLYQRNMYPLAIDLAQKAGMDAQQKSIIYKKSGDHLYQKGDYDAAMTQYIKAIDTTEPSQVIRKVSPSWLVCRVKISLTSHSSSTPNGYRILSNTLRSCTNIGGQRRTTPHCF